MPAKAGIQVHFQSKYKTRLDSGMRRNDGSASRLPLDRFRTLQFGADGCSVVQFVALRAGSVSAFIYRAHRTFKLLIDAANDSLSEKIERARAAEMGARTFLSAKSQRALESPRSFSYKTNAEPVLYCTRSL